jgi:hypothetical protein
MSLFALAAIGFTAGLLIGMNPVLISSFLAYITSLIGRGSSNKKYTLAGFIFIFYFVIFIVFFSTAFASFVSFFNADYQLSIALVTTLFAIAVGIMLIRRYFYPGPAIKPPQNVTTALHDSTTKNTGLLNIMGLAMVVVYATLPTIGIVVALMSILGVIVGPSSLVWNIPFTLGLVTPIYVVLAMLSNKTKPSAILAWKEKTKPTMRLYNGLVLIALAWTLLYLITRQGGGL